MDIAKVQTLINNGQPIKLELHNLSDSIQRFLNSVVLELLSYYSKDNLFLATYTALFEVSMNAVKANAKKAYFKHIGLNMLDNSDYKRGAVEFKKLINKNLLNHYSDLAKEQGLFVKILIEHSGDGIKINVTNNCQLLRQEEFKIRTKLSLGRKYNDIMDFYSNHSDQTEGEGLGLVVCLLMLKQEGIPTADFRVGCKDGITKTRIEIPFTPKYLSERKKYELEQEQMGF